MRIVQPDGLPPPRRQVAVAALYLGVLTLVTEGIAVTMALPRIAAAFGVSAAESAWVVIVYQVVLMAAILPLSSAGLIFGYRRVCLWGLLLFGAGGVGSVLAQGFGALVACRALQALGAAGVMSVNLALLRHILPAARFGRAMGLHAMAIALAGSAAAPLAGLILSVAPWQGVIAVAIPAAVVAAAAGAAVFPPNSLVPQRYDAAGALLAALSFGPLPLAAALLGRDAPGAVVALLALAAGALLLLLRRMRGSAAPLLPVDLLDIRLFALSLAASVCAFAAQSVVLVVLPFELQAVLGLPPLQAGLVFMAWAGATALLAPVAGILSDRIRPGLLGLAGLGLLAAGVLLLLPAAAAGSAEAMAGALAACGAGFALFQPPNNRTLMSVAPRERAGAASGMVGTARLLGQAVGTAAATVALGRGVEGAWETALTIALGLAVAGAAASALRRA